MAKIDPQAAGVSEEQWREATASCVRLAVSEVVRETHDSCSLVFEVPPELEARFRYRAGQFLSFKVPFEGKVLTRSYSLSSSPEWDEPHRVTVKRVDKGRISNWINDEIAPGDELLVVPPAGLFLLNEKRRPISFFAGGSGITPCLSLIKTALATTDRTMRLVYANRDERSIIFGGKLDELHREYPGRLEVHHHLDDREGFLDLKAIEHHAVECLEGDFYLCGPSEFMDLVERALAALHVPSDQIHIERFVSPPDPGREPGADVAFSGEVSQVAPETITVVLDGRSHEVPYQAEQRVLAAARNAGLDPPFSCEEGYCSCCMAKLTQGKVRMVTNDCLTQDLLEEGWVLTCQSVCVSRNVKVEYPD